MIWRNKAIAAAVIGIAAAMASPTLASRYGPSFAFFLIFLLYFDAQGRKRRRERN